MLVSGHLENHSTFCPADDEPSHLGPHGKEECLWALQLSVLSRVHQKLHRHEQCGHRHKIHAENVHCKPKMKIQTNKKIDSKWMQVTQNSQQFICFLSGIDEKTSI